MDFEEFEIDEKKMLNNDFNICFDVISQEHENSEQFLYQNEGDNILLIRRFGNNFSVACYSRENLRKMIQPRREPPFVLKNCRNNYNEESTYLSLNIGGVECFFPREEVRRIIRSNYKIYYVKETTEQIRCRGILYTIYRVYICGGVNCLPQIIRDEEPENPWYDNFEDLEEEEEEEEEEDEEEDAVGVFYGPGEQDLNSNSSNTNMNVFRQEILNYEMENPDSYPTITLFRKVEDLIVNDEDYLSKNIAILVDKFGPLLLLQEYNNKNNMQHFIDFINEEEHSEEQIREWLDLFFFENEYLINSLPDINLIEYAVEQGKDRVANILRNYEEVGQEKIATQLERHNQLIQRLEEEDYTQIRFDILNIAENYQKNRLVHRLTKLLRDGNRRDYNKVLRELRYDEGVGEELTEVIDEEVREILGLEEDEGSEEEGSEEEGSEEEGSEEEGSEEEGSEEEGSEEEGSEEEGSEEEDE